MSFQCTVSSYCDRACARHVTQASDFAFRTGSLACTVLGSVEPACGYGTSYVTSPGVMRHVPDQGLAEVSTANLPHQPGTLVYPCSNRVLHCKAFVEVPVSDMKVHQDGVMFPVFGIDRRGSWCVPMDRQIQLASQLRSADHPLARMSVRLGRQLACG